MEILEDKKNSLLSRQEIKVIIEMEKTPSLDEARKLIANNFKKPEENIVIEKIKGKFGIKTFLIEARIYDTKEKKEEIEPKKKETKGDKEKKEGEIKEDKKESGSEIEESKEKEGQKENKSEEKEKDG